MSAFGSINQKMPIVQVVGSVSGSFTVSPYSSGSTLRTTSGNSGTVGVAVVDKGRVYKHCHDLLSSGLASYPGIVGNATITISNPSDDLDGNSITTRVHYTFNNRNPGIGAFVPVGNASPALELNQAIADNINQYQIGGTRVNVGSIVVYNNCPISNLITLKLRTYKVASVILNGESISAVSPSDRSSVLIVKFALKLS